MSSLWYNLDEAFFDVAEGIRTVVAQLDTSPVTPSEVLTPQAASGESEAASLTALPPQPAKPPSSLKPEAISLLRTLAGDVGSVTSVAFSPDGQILASGNFEKMIKIWGEKKMSRQ
jgi:WD40 repeat protein